MFIHENSTNTVNFYDLVTELSQAHFIDDYSHAIEMFKKIRFKDKEIEKLLDKFGNTPIHLAVQFKNWEQINFLLRKGASLYKVNFESKDAITIAEKSYSGADIKKLMDYHKTAEEYLDSPKLEEDKECSGEYGKCIEQRMEYARNAKKHLDILKRKSAIAYEAKDMESIKRYIISAKEHLDLLKYMEKYLSDGDAAADYYGKKTLQQYISEARTHLSLLGGIETYLDDLKFESFLC